MVALMNAYGESYDPRPAIDGVRAGKNESLNELWENLYHQGDINSASYFAVPALVSLEQLDLVACIEVARQFEHNPDIPSELKDDYFSALNLAIAAPPMNKENFMSYYSIHASIFGQYDIARALFIASAEEILDEFG